MDGSNAAKRQNLKMIVLHDPHDFIEKNPIGQPLVALQSILGNGVYFHILAVELDAGLVLHHILKQLNLQEGEFVELFLKSGLALSVN